MLNDPIKLRSQLLAKVPGVERRTSCTYGTFKQLNQALKDLGSSQRKVSVERLPFVSLGAVVQSSERTH